MGVSIADTRYRECEFTESGYDARRHASPPRPPPRPALAAALRGRARPALSRHRQAVAERAPARERDPAPLPWPAPARDAVGARGAQGDGAQARPHAARPRSGAA